MGTFDKFADTPDQIRKEGQEITLRFNRTGPNTGRISWNIPAPNAGCGTGVQAYNGIVITLSLSAANYLSTSPKSGTFYTGDPTADADLHAGDTIDGALVLAALYDDKTTTYIDITGLTERTAYYISGYAVDNVARYHREGVHAYSLPSGIEVGSTADKAAYHNVSIDVVGGVQLSTPTGLLPDTDYDFKLKLGKVEHTITLAGEDCEFYGDMVDALNEQLWQLGDVYSSPLSPRSNELHYNATTKKLFIWNGTSTIELDVLTHSADPTLQSVNALWYVPSTGLLNEFDGSDWDAKTFISNPSDPANPSCEQTWFDGTNVWSYKLSHWEKLFTYVQTRNPLLGPLMSCDDYWYNTDESVLSVWNLGLKAWVAVDAIYAATDPSLLNTGDFWYDETAERVKQYVSGWNVVTSTMYIDEAEADGTFGDTAGYAFVFVKDVQKLYSRNTTTSEWDEEVIVAFPTDPRDRTTSKLWWDSTADELKYWDEIGSAWVEVTSFTQSASDPSLPQPVAANSAWYNPDTGEIKLIFATACQTIYPIVYTQNPLALSNGTIWYNPDTLTWYRKNGSDWDEVEPMYFESDPYDVGVGYYWYDTTNSLLKKWSGTAWTTVTFVTKPTVIAIGTYWFNTSNNVIYVWDGTQWTVSIGVAAVEFIPAADSTSRSVLSFYTRGLGCSNYIEVIVEADLLLSEITQSVIWSEPVHGASGLDGGVMYKQLGVGDDGSPDERRTLMNDILISFGHPVMRVELTKEQLDLCVNNALMELRKKSSYSYTRAYFFLDMMPNQQTYLLTNRCVGFNKIVNIHAIHRVKAAMLRSSAFSNDMFAFSALQQLYSAGTFDILSYHLVAGYMEELETLFAARIMFNWNERNRELGLHQEIGGHERVLLDASIERTEQDLMTDRQTASWLRRWSIAEAKKLLSMTRGKFQTLPGPNGSTTLNFADLHQQALDEMELLRAELDDNSMQDLVGVGMKAHFFIG